jgi:hypothetical protein
MFVYVGQFCGWLFFSVLFKLSACLAYGFIGTTCIFFATWGSRGFGKAKDFLIFVWTAIGLAWGLLGPVLYFCYNYLAGVFWASVSTGDGVVTVFYNSGAHVADGCCSSCSDGGGKSP